MAQCANQRRLLLTALALAPLAALLRPRPALGADGAALGLKGYDVVAYFDEGKPRLGLPEHQMDWDERRYQFNGPRHKALFAENPERYLPQFAGFCAVGVSMGKKVVADPTVWKIVDGRLYVFSSPKALEMAEKDPELLKRSQQNWSSGK